jgi:hypothetical protein
MTVEVLAPSPELLSSLERFGLLHDGAPPMTPLTGGVSSEIWRVDAPTGSVVVKRALPQLRVAGVWRASVERTRYEVAWMRRAESIVPGTLTQAADALAAARATGRGAIVSARSGESEDVTIVHLAVGWQVEQLKVGSITRGERTAKWNEALRIEEQLGARARFAGRHPLARSAT